MPETIQWGIIGCGDVTEVKSGPAFNKVPASKLVAVMRRNAKKAADYAKRHGVPKWYSNAQELIDDPEVNAIYIATPPLQHEEYALAAIKAGKPVYVEKPMAVSATVAERMQKAADEAGIKICVAHYRRQQPLFKKIKALIDETAIGDVRFVQLQTFQPAKSKIITQTEDNWRVNPAVSGGGLFHDLSPHQLDLMIYFFGNPQQAFGYSSNQAKMYDADDITTGTIAFENGVLFSGTWCFSVPPEETKDYCEIIGSKGKIGFKVFEQDGLTLSVDGEVKKIEFDKLAHVQQPMIEAVVSYFIGESPNPSSADDGVRVMKLIDTFTKNVPDTSFL